MLKQKAFTLAEIFIAMVILSVLVSVCLTFFVKRHDYEREYFYYTAYKNIVNVVDAALMNEKYLYTNDTAPRTEYSTCGSTAGLKKCRVFKTGMSATTGLCSIFKDYFNTVSDSCATTTTSPAAATTSALKITNGMDIYFATVNSAAITALTDATLANAEITGYRLWVDINGHGQGEDKENYDIFEFYITRSGKVVPVYGSVSGIRGYEYIPADMDGGANNELMSFDVIYSPEDDETDPPENHYLVIGDDFRSVPFPKAACASGYLSSATPYCTQFKYNCDASGSNCTQGVTKAATCTNDYADCKIRLVKKLKRLK